MKENEKAQIPRSLSKLRTGNGAKEKGRGERKVVKKPRTCSTNEERGGANRAAGFPPPEKESTFVGGGGGAKNT